MLASDTLTLSSMTTAIQPDIDVLTMGTCLVELTPGDGGLTIAEAPTFHKLATGAAALFSSALARLGAKPALLSAVGDDEFGQFVIAELRCMGVNADYILQVPGQLTSVSFASADGHGGKTFRFYRFPGYSDPLGTFDSAAIPEAVLQSARLFDFTESCIRASGPLRESAFDLARRSRKLGRQSCYAPNWRPILWDCGVDEARSVQQQAVKLCDILLLNGEEAGLISGKSIASDAAKCLGDLGPRTVVITGGGEGPAIVWNAGAITYVCPVAVQVRYDVGAGDTFHAGFVAAQLRGLGAVEAARFAAGAAALKITRPPSLSDLPSREDVEEFLEGSSQ